MKRILAALLCALLLCAVPITAFAEEIDSAEAEGTVEDNSTPETEAPTEDEISGEEDAPELTPEEEAALTTEKIIAYVQEHLEEISVIITMILTVFYQIRKHAALNKSIGTLNNNAVTVAESSHTAIGKALTEVQSVSAVVNGYKEEIAAFLVEARANEEEKQKLQQALTDVQAHLKTSKLANVELANEVAELLVLANIPNSKKEELYSRHRAAVAAISEAEKSYSEATVEEVKADEVEQEA